MEEDAFERKRLSENRRPSPVAVAPSEELPDSAAWEMKGFRRPDLMIRVFWGKVLTLLFNGSVYMFRLLT